LRIFELEATSEYQTLQKEYTTVKNTFDPNAIFDFLHKHSAHCEAIYDASEYFRLKGDYKNANELLERLLYIYEESIGYYFNQVID
jgi:hypothetical protein